MKKKPKFKEGPFNLYKPGTTKYYRDVLSNIAAICWDYDGYNPNSAKQMRGLVDDIKDQAKKALGGKPQYIKWEMERRGENENKKNPTR